MPAQATEKSCQAWDQPRLSGRVEASLRKQLTTSQDEPIRHLATGRPELVTVSRMHYCLLYVFMAATRLQG